MREESRGVRRPAVLPVMRGCKDGGGCKLTSIHGAGERDEREREGKEEGDA